MWRLKSFLNLCTSINAVPMFCHRLGSDLLWTARASVYFELAVNLYLAMQIWVLERPQK
jgi:hypothetical protein